MEEFLGLGLDDPNGSSEPPFQRPTHFVSFLPQGIPQAVFIGHDWGGMLVWNMALFHPERVR